MSLLASQQIVSKVGGTISCIGSGYIIRDVLRHPNKRSQSIYHRIMVGLSIMDISLSLPAHILSSWPMPRGSYLWAVGTATSCEIAAFFSMVGYVGSPLYNCSLASFYTLRLKYNWSDSRMKKAEKWFHIVPWSISVVLSIILLCTKSYGPSVGYCGPASDSTFGCDESDELGVECIGSSHVKFAVIFANLVPFICMFFVPITMFRLYRAVHDVEANALRYSFTARLRAHDKRKSMKRSRRIMIQGVLYSVAMMLVWVPMFIGAIIFAVSKNICPSHILIATISNTLLGAFNFCIYMIPAFEKILTTRREQKRTRMLEKQFQLSKENEESEEEGMMVVPHISPSLLCKTASSSECNIRKLSSSEDHNNSMIFIEEENEEIEEMEEIESLSPPFRLEIFNDNEGERI